MEVKILWQLVLPKSLYYYRKKLHFFNI